MLHMLAAYWGFVLAGVHCGMNARRVLAGGRKGDARAGTRRVLSIAGSPNGPWRWKMPNASPACRFGAWVVRIVVVAVACYGVAAFVNRGFARYLLAQNHFAFFDAAESVARYLLDYLAVTVLFAVAGYALACLLARMGKRGRAAGRD